MMMINWEELNLPQVDGAGLDLPFTEDEVWKAIKLSPIEKAPGPDGFSGGFFRACWPIIKEDIMQVFQQFYHLGGANAASINTAMIALLPKKNGASEIGHYCPISLIHSIGKLLAKVLSI